MLGGRLKAFIHEHILVLVTVAALVGLASGGLLYAVGITTISGARAGTDQAPPPSGIEPIQSNIAHRDEFPSDQAAVAHVANALPFQAHLPTSIPAGLELRAATAQVSHASSSLVLLYGAPGWNGSSLKGYGGAVIQIQEIPAPAHPVIGGGVEVSIGIPGSTVWEVQGAPSDQMAFVLQTATIQYDIAIFLNGNKTPDRDQILAMISGLAK